MKKFKFQLEALLTIRVWNEQKAQQALGAIVREIEGLKAQIIALGHIREKTTNEWVAGCQLGFNPANRIAYDYQIQNLDEQCTALEESVKAADKKRIKALSTLERTAQEKRIVENMKEKRLREYEVELEKHETNEIEDIFNGRRKGVWS